MIQAKNLDNQKFDEITKRAVSRIATYSDNWTNFNLSDPGITLIDLFAWYKEMEQYELNFYSDAIAERLLRLTGIKRMNSRPAECMIHISDSPGHRRPKHSRLETPEGVIFEIEEEISEKIPEIKGVYIRENGKETDVSGILEEGVGIHPFEELKSGRTELIIDFESNGQENIWISFDIAEHTGVKRNPPDEFTETPRDIFWHFEGSDQDCMLEDETNAFSRSGRISFKADGRRIVGSLMNPGCEEEVIIRKINCGDYRAIQKRTIAGTEYRKVDSRERILIDVENDFEDEVGLTLFLRSKKGWKQIGYEAEYSENMRIEAVNIDSREAVQDGADNLRICYAEALLYEELFFDSTGMPDQEVQLTLKGNVPLEESFCLICDSLMEDGSISEEEWREVSDFYSEGPRSRVFVYDRETERIIFGDGKKGAIVPRGKGAILISGMEVSECSGGNIPKNSGLKFINEEKEVENSEANFGRDREEIKDMMMRCRNRINDTHKCVTAADYERAAKGTPGLRVGHAKAIPGFDRKEPTKVSRYPVVTVVVIPDSDKALPLPDEKFLRAVRRVVEKRRIIGTLVRVCGPVYIPIDVRIETVSSGKISQELVEEKIREALTLGNRRNIGDPVSEGDLEAAISEIDEIVHVTRMEITTNAPECSKDAYGYLELPKDGVPWLRSIKIRN
ncbi:MAG: baseplate J/gp47 family protein [Lachnospiraceae bacterium]|nr:baseplate J/gp47 family protein [Lachnospiraceae bacterium]